jgi:hypothetical protein
MLTYSISLVTRQCSISVHESEICLAYILHSFVINFAACPIGSLYQRTSAQEIPCEAENPMTGVS